MRQNLSYLDNIVHAEKVKNRIAKAADDDSSDDDVPLVKLENKAVQVSVKQSADLSAGGAFSKGGAAPAGGNGRAGAELFDTLRAKEAEEWIKLDHYHAAVSLFSHSNLVTAD